MGDALSVPFIVSWTDTMFTKAVNTFAPEPPVTARADPRPFYRL